MLLIQHSFFGSSRTALKRLKNLGVKGRVDLLGKNRHPVVATSTALQQVPKLKISYCHSRHMAKSPCGLKRPFGPLREMGMKVPSYFSDSLSGIEP